MGGDFWFLLFGLLWFTNLVAAIGIYLVANCVGIWYFTPFQSEEEIAENGGTRDAPKRTAPCVRLQVRNQFKFHLGSLQFGAFILALVQLAKWYLEMIKRQANASGNKVMEKIATIIQCCVRCIEKCVRYLNKNQYIQMSLYGTNFCISAFNGLALILRNAARISVLTVISQLINAFGILFITLGTQIVGYRSYRVSKSITFNLSFYFLEIILNLDLSRRINYKFKYKNKTLILDFNVI